MGFEFGAAKHLYQTNAHPRIFFGRKDLPAIRKNLQTGDGRKIASAFRKRVTAKVENVLAADESELLAGADVMGSPVYRAMSMSFEAGVLAVLDDNENAVEAVRWALRLAPIVEKTPPKDQQARHRVGCSAAGTLARAYDLVQPQLSVKERVAFCRWAYRSGVKVTLDGLFPGHHLRAGGNIVMNQLLSAVNVMLAIDGEEGVPDLTKEWARALPMFEATLNVVVGPEGYPAEDMGYGTAMAGRVAQTAEPLKRAGLLDVYEICPRYLEFGNAILHFVQPWGQNLSTTGDHGDDFGGRVFVLARLAEETQNPALLWLLGTLPYRADEITLRKGVQIEDSVYSLLVGAQVRGAVHPAKLKPQPATHFRDRARGLVSFRSGWGKDNTFVVFDGSQRCPAAQGHEHASSGHFSISAFGEYFAVDTGRYNLEQNCHSVVLVDGKSGRSTDGEWISVKHEGTLTGFAPGEFVDTASVDSSHQHECYWARRTLGLVKGRGAPPYVWVVDDINKDNDWAEYWWQLHTCPENTIQTHKSHATTTGWRHGNKMDVHFALPAPDEYLRPHELVELTQDEVEPSSYNYVGPFRKERLAQFSRPAEQIHYSTFVRPRLLAKIAGLNGRFMSIMLPREKGTKAAKVKRLKSLPGCLAVRITFGDVEDVLMFAHEHRVLDAADVSARADWCVVRRSRKSGKVLDYALGEGARLEVAGREQTV